VGALTRPLLLPPLCAMLQGGSTPYVCNQDIGAEEHLLVRRAHRTAPTLHYTTLHYTTLHYTTLCGSCCDPGWLLGPAIAASSASARLLSRSLSPSFVS
jgi:hypothetical protein